MASEQFDLHDLIMRTERLSDLWRQAADSMTQGIPSWLELDIQQLEQSLRAPLQALIRFVGSLPDDPDIAALLSRLTDGVDKDKKQEAEKPEPITQHLAQHSAETYSRLAELLKQLGFAPPAMEEAAPLDDFESLPPPPPQVQPQPPQPQPPAPKPGSVPDRSHIPEPQFGGSITPAPATRAAADVHFSAYYPSRVGAIVSRYALIVYAHLAELLTTIEADAQKFAQELGGSLPPRIAAQQSARLATDTPITVTPECDGLTFDPPALTKTWDGSWTRFNFDLKPTAATYAKTITGRIAICVGLIEIAHIDFSIEAAAAQPAIAGANPLALAKLASNTAKLYQKIFVSYSRRDREIVESYRVAQIALGNDVFVDTESIRSGQNWQAALAQAIDNADIFQLFWSPNSAASANVRDEWDYALHYRCPQTQCAEFLRPVYWQNPLTPPPAELGHLNFRYIPVQTKEPDSFFQRLRKLFGSG